MQADEVNVRRIGPARDSEGAFCCMDEVPTPWPEALCACRQWLARNLGRHVEGYHTVLPDGTVAGHLYFSPSERALVPFEAESGTVVLYCEWVRTPYQGVGLGRRQFSVFIDDMRRDRIKGVLVECGRPGAAGDPAPYRRRGFKTLLHGDESELLYLPITQPEARVAWRPSLLQPRHGRPVQVQVLSGYRCPVDAATLLMLREVTQEFGDQVVLNELALSPQTLARFGSVAGIFINGRRALEGGETEEAIRQAILEAF